MAELYGKEMTKIIAEKHEKETKNMQEMHEKKSKSLQEKHENELKNKERMKLKTRIKKSFNTLKRIFPRKLRQFMKKLFFKKKKYKPYKFDKVFILRLKQFILTNLFKLFSIFNNLNISLIIDRLSYIKSFVYNNLKTFKYKIQTLFSKTILLLKEKNTRLKNLIINFNYKEEIVKKYFKRLSLVIKLYYLPFIVLIKNLSIAVKESQNRVAINYFSQLNGLIPKFLQSFEIDFYIFIGYYTLFCTSKNPLSINKETTEHGVLCLTHLLITTALGFGYQLLNNIIESVILFLDICFNRFILKKFRLHLSLNNRYPKDTKFLPIEEIFKTTYGMCEYERFTKKLSNQALSFLNSSIFCPIFLILVITLLYNCCYYIAYNRQPYIPVLTNLAKKLTPNLRKD